MKTAQAAKSYNNTNEKRYAIEKTMLMLPTLMLPGRRPVLTHLYENTRRRIPTHSRTVERLSVPVREGHRVALHLVAAPVYDG